MSTAGIGVNTCVRGDVAEVCVEAQPEVGALLRMKLGGYHVLMSHDGCEVDSVVCCGHDRFGLRRIGVVGVDEVEIRPVGDLLHEWMRSADRDVVPANLRNL